MTTLFLALPLGGCMEASTLGQQAPDHVLITGTPTWSNGIGQLVNLKCANCHQVPRLASSPQNVPADLDLRFEKSFGAIRAAQDIAAQIALGVLQHDLVYGDGRAGYVNASLNVTVHKMPLLFSTPLYADEITALQTWAGAWDSTTKTVGASGVLAAELAGASPTLSGANPMTVADGEVLYKRHCQSCHGVYGAGGLVQRPLSNSLGGYTASSGPAFAKALLSIAPQYPMNTWPLHVQFANLCTPVGAPTTCNGTQLDAIAAFLAQL